MSLADKFIKKATEIHGGKFDYRGVHFVDSSTLITIRCKVCGETFIQTPLTHIKYTNRMHDSCIYKGLSDIK